MLIQKEESSPAEKGSRRGASSRKPHDDSHDLPSIDPIDLDDTGTAIFPPRFGCRTGLSRSEAPVRLEAPLGLPGGNFGMGV